MKYKLLLSAFLFQLTLNAQHLSFDGSDDFVEYGDVLDQTGSFTVSAWAYNDGNDGVIEQDVL